MADPDCGTNTWITGSVKDMRWAAASDEVALDDGCDGPQGQLAADRNDPGAVLVRERGRFGILWGEDPSEAVGFVRRSRPAKVPA